MSEFSLTEDDFESEHDSTLLIRERARGSNLEGSYQKMKEILLEQSNYTCTFLPAGRSEKLIISKRDVEQTDNRPHCSKWQTRVNEQKTAKRQKGTATN